MNLRICATLLAYFACTLEVAGYDLDDATADHQAYAIMMSEQYGDVGAAIKSFRAAVRFNEASATWGNLGIALQDERNPDRQDPQRWLAALREAQQALTKALALNPHNHHASQNMQQNRQLLDAAELEATEEKDYYGVLGVEEDADEKVIKKAFRTLSKKFHPDKQQGGAGLSRAEAKKLFDDTREAYETLSDAGKRAIYDARGVKGLIEYRKTEGQRDMWGNAVSSIPKSANIEQYAHVSLTTLYSGGETTYTWNRKRVCRICRTDPRNERCRKCQRCPDQLEMRREIMNGMIVQRQVRVASEDYCRTERKTLTAVIEKGMPAGHKITFPYAADQEPGHAPGDVVFHLHMSPGGADPSGSGFARVGDNLRLDVDITLKEALVGFTKSITHLDGHTVKVTAKGVTKPGLVREVHGEGMPKHNYPSEFGKLVIKFNVQFPKSLDSDMHARVLAWPDRL